MKRRSILVATTVVLCATIIAFVSPRLTAQTNQSNRQLTQGAQPQQNSQRRLALVIGNGAYEHAGRLANPPNDATLVAATLQQLGFEVKNGSNLTQREMKQRIREFGQTLRTNGGVGLFYFAGHGVQAKGHNYIVPVDADIQTEADLEDVAVDLNYVLNLMDDAQNALNIVILDACRNNPFARSFRSAQEGLAQVKAPTGTLIAYATAPDSIAADGTGSNSPYTEELIKQMRSSGVLVETMFRRVTERVSARTKGKQEPWFSANVKGDFYFLRDNTASSATPIIGPAAISDAAREQALWDAVKDSNDARDFQDYLAKYPNGAYAETARVRLRRMDPASLTTKIEFDATDSDPASYLATFGITLTDITPGSQLVIYDSNKFYEGKAIKAAAGKLLAQIGSNEPVSFTIRFETPLRTVKFMRPMLIAGASGIIFPEWTAYAVAEDGRETDAIGEVVGRYYTDQNAKTFELKGPGIRAIRFKSNSYHEAAFNAIVIDNLVLIK